MAVLGSLLAVMSTTVVAAETRLAAGGKALLPVIVSPGASERTRTAAGELAEFLGRISGARFEVETGDGTTGIAVGVPTDFPRLTETDAFRPGDPFRRDDYLLHSHPAGVHVLGAGELAVHLAVWDLLHRLGYRLYFLTDTWEVVPERPELAISVEALERPDFVTREAPRGAPWSDRALWQRWRLRNRVESSFVLNTGHAYDAIIRANADIFASHPEYYALVDGQRRLAGQVDGRGNIKFCIGNPTLRRTVVDHAVRLLRAQPELDSISLDPSDGANWCECPDCARLGSVSDRVLTLANQVAEAINAIGLGPKVVGIYAYNQHSPPPSIAAHPRVVVSVATSFIRGGYTLEDLIEGWSARGATLGIREYHDVFAWSHDLPRKARGGDLAYLQRTIPDFQRQGARFVNSENADSWGANGLGYWITPRLLWDVDAATKIEALVEDFLQRAFGRAAEPMRAFYTLLNLDTSLRADQDLVARLYRHLQAARQATQDAAVHRRLDDLVLYTRYLELYAAYRLATGEARQQAFEQVWRHAYRMRDRSMLSTVAICHRDRFRDPSVEVPADAGWDIPEPENPWKSSRPFAADEVAGILARGIEANRPTEIPFTPVAYGSELLPAEGLEPAGTGPGQRPDTFRHLQRVHTWLPENRREIRLRVTGGLIPHYRDRGNVRFALYAAAEATLEPVARDHSVPPDGAEHSIVLRSPYSGAHTLEWTDGGDRTRVVWTEDLPFTLRSTAEDPMRIDGRWDLTFYVPRGTACVGGYTTATAGRLVNAQGTEVFSFAAMPHADYFAVPVLPGTDGAFWRFEDCLGARILLTVPPYLAPSPEHLLLPREVVEADAQRPEK